MGWRQSRDQTLALVPPAEPAKAVKASVSRHYGRHGSQRRVPPNPHRIRISKLGNCLHNCGRQGLEFPVDTSAPVGRTLLSAAFDVDLCSPFESPLTSAVPGHTIADSQLPAQTQPLISPPVNFCFASGGDLGPRERLMKIMRTMLILTMLLFATMSAGQGKPDEAAIRKILQEEVAAWNKGDAQGYSRHFAADGTFTNILGT